MVELAVLDSVDWITTGAIGEPGARTFLLQARTGAEHLAVVLEKTQVAALAEVTRQVLDALEVGPADFDPARQQLAQPVVPAWRAAALALGSDEAGQRFVLEVAQIPDSATTEPTVLRWGLRRDQLAALSAAAAAAVQQGGRPVCRYCGETLAAVHQCQAAGGVDSFVV